MVLSALFLLVACKPEQAAAPAVPPPKPGPVAQVEAPKPAKASPLQLTPLFRDIERRTFQFFWDTTNEVLRDLATAVRQRRTRHAGNAPMA